MLKKAIICLLIMLFAIIMLAVQLASGTVHHISGVNYPYSAGEHPVYSECYHDTFPGASDNSEVGLGVMANYYGPLYFGRAWWDFNAQFGDGDVNMYSGLVIDPCTNGYEHHYYTYYGQPVWTTPSGAWYQCWYVHYEINPGGTPVPIGAKTSVEGFTTAVFYHPSCPPWAPCWGEYWWLDAYTQNPNDPNDPNGWSFLHAWDEQ